MLGCRHDDWDQLRAIYGTMAGYILNKTEFEDELFSLNTAVSALLQNHFRRTGERLPWTFRMTATTTAAGPMTPAPPPPTEPEDDPSAASSAAAAVETPQAVRGGVWSEPDAWTPSIADISMDTEPAGPGAKALARDAWRRWLLKAPKTEWANWLAEKSVAELDVTMVYKA